MPRLYFHYTVSGITYGVKAGHSPLFIVYLIVMIAHAKFYILAHQNVWLCTYCVKDLNKSCMQLRRFGKKKASFVFVSMFAPPSDRRDTLLEQ